MTSKLAISLLLLGWMLLIGCSSKDPLPVNTWSEGCVELTPSKDGYRISGICCAYVSLPGIILNGHAFTVKADYYTFNGASFVPIPIVVNGKLSSNGKVLVITYSVHSTTTTHTLRPGNATSFCYCGCD